MKMIRSNVNPLTFPELFVAGHARLTLRNNKAETHITIHVKQARDKKDRKIKLPIFFINVSLLGDSEAGYVFGGTYFAETGTVGLAKGTLATSKMGKTIRLIGRLLKTPKDFRKLDISLLHEGRCCSCGLALTNPTSIQHGLGDDCYTRTFGTDEEKAALELKNSKRKPRTRKFTVA